MDNKPISLEILSYFRNKLLNNDINKKVNLPVAEDGNIEYGTVGQVLLSNGDGTTSWGNPAPSNKFNGLVLVDEINGYDYFVSMRDGELVTYCIAVGIEVTTPPDKISYKENEAFDPTGMVVSAICADGSTREVTGYTFSDISADGIVAISYTEGDNTFTTTLELEIASVEDLLIDFEYIDNKDGTYTLTAWKQTLNGEPSTECIIPSNSNIIL